MRASPRDRRGLTLTALCLALILISAPAAAGEAIYQVLPGGGASEVSVRVTGSEHVFWNPGLMGERVPLQVENLTVLGPLGPVEYQDAGRGTITFPDGNYTITYRVSVTDNHLVAAFDNPYNITIILPEGLDVRNPLIGMTGRGATVSSGPNETMEITWERVRVAEIRYYTPEREILLITFGTVWIAVALVLILPLLISRRR